jgi:hypothetical protein
VSDRTKNRDIRAPGYWAVQKMAEEAEAISRNLDLANQHVDSLRGAIADCMDFVRILGRERFNDFLDHLQQNGSYDDFTWGLLADVLREVPV